jgi:hypothetical protein
MTLAPAGQLPLVSRELPLLKSMMATACEMKAELSSQVIRALVLHSINEGA